jgi:hypothetical protein
MGAAPLERFQEHQENMKGRGKEKAGNRCSKITPETPKPTQQRLKRGGGGIRGQLLNTGITLPKRGMSKYIEGREKKNKKMGILFSS